MSEKKPETNNGENFNNTKINLILDELIEYNELLIEIKKEFNELIDNFLSYKDGTREYYYYFNKILEEVKKIKNSKKINVLVDYLKKIKKGKNGTDIIKINFLILKIRNLKYNKITENLEKKESSFRIKGGDCGKYIFTKENFEDLKNNEFNISLDFLKGNYNSNNINFENYLKIKYLGNNLIEYFDKNGGKLGEILLKDYEGGLKEAILSIQNGKEKIDINLYLNFNK